MQFVVLMFLPIIVAACGGGLVTDADATKRKIGMVLVYVAAAGVCAMIIYGMINPTYYIVAS